MATAKRVKANIEFLLAKAEIKGVPEKVLLKSRNIAQGVLDVDELPAEGEERTVTVPLIRPLTGRSIGSLTMCLRS